MKFKKVFSDQLDHCYALLHLKAVNQDFLIVASEEDQPCYAYDLNHHWQRTTVWPNIGGTMTLVAIPGTLNFLATQKFYPGFNSATCRIVKETFTGHGWQQTIVGECPYIHRFDIIPKTSQAGFWYVGCSIANSKQKSDDWSDPGKIWVGEYDDDQERLFNLHALNQRITQNHGYQRLATCSLITGREGIFRLNWPTKTQSWQLQQLTTAATSDICCADINQDGAPEYLTITDFHGSYLRLYDQHFQLLQQTTTNTPFGHALFGGPIGNREYFLFGWRAGQQGLALIAHSDLKLQLIEAGVGPSNVLIYQKQQQAYLLAANREANEVAVYQILLD